MALISKQTEKSDELGNFFINNCSFRKPNILLELPILIFSIGFFLKI